MIRQGMKVLDAALEALIAKETDWQMMACQFVVLVKSDGVLFPLSTKELFELK
ncbi:MAG: hypothetical protein WBB65_11465 [Anaerolineales bacterium]